MLLSRIERRFRAKIFSQNHRNVHGGVSIEKEKRDSGEEEIPWLVKTGHRRISTSLSNPLWQPPMARGKT
jgi:hypothetical protein